MTVLCWCVWERKREEKEKEKEEKIHFHCRKWFNLLLNSKTCVIPLVLFPSAVTWTSGGSVWVDEFCKAEMKTGKFSLLSLLITVIHIQATHQQTTSFTTGPLKNNHLTGCLTFVFQHDGSVDETWGHTTKKVSATCNLTYFALYATCIFFL